MFFKLYSGVFGCKLPGQTPHQCQVVFSSGNKMTAIICELQTSDVLVVTTEDRQQPTCGDLDQSHISIFIDYIRNVMSEHGVDQKLTANHKT